MTLLRGSARPGAGTSRAGLRPKKPAGLSMNAGLRVSMAAAPGHGFGTPRGNARGGGAAARRGPARDPCGRYSCGAVSSPGSPTALAAPGPPPTAVPGTVLLSCDSANWGQLGPDWRAGSLRAGPLWFVDGRQLGYV